MGCLHSRLQSFHGIPIVELTSSTSPQIWDVVISTGGHIDRLAAGTIQLQYRRLIAWIHHPFDHDKLNKAASLGAEILSIGKAQYLSNVLLAGPHHHIDNLFCAARIREEACWDRERNLARAKPRQGGLMRIGYMGGLIPSKGFHLLAEQWGEIRQNLASMGIRTKLEVIGGSNLYQFDQGHSQLPCEQAYGDRLLTILGQEVGRSVQFHGTLGSTRYALMAQCDLAVVNPSGSGEAFPATILEWLSLGVPVVASQHYGCADAMQLLPSLCINNPKEIPNTIRRVVQSSDQAWLELRQHCAQIGSTFSSQQALIIQQWMLLLTKRDPQLKIHEYLPASALRLLLKSYAGDTIHRGKQTLKRWLFKRRTFRG